MICPCGGRTLSTTARQPSAVLCWDQCGACGRCANFELKVWGQPVAKAHAAQRAFHDERLMEIIRKRVECNHRLH